MIDRLTAQTQARISYAILFIYFALKLLEGLKLIDSVSGDLKEVLVAMTMFWFMRARNQEKPSDPTIR